MLVAAVAVFLAGCAGNGEDGWRASGCAKGDGPSGNAPLVALFDGGDRDVAERVSGAFGDSVTGPSKDASGSAYDSGRGMWRVEREPPMVSFFGTGDAWMDEARMRHGLEELGLDVTALQREEALGGVDFGQWFEGAPISRAGFVSLQDTTSPGAGYGVFTTIEVQDLRDLEDAHAAVGASEASGVAAAYLGCAEEWKDLDLRFVHSSFDVVMDSLVHSVVFEHDTPDQHCTTSYAFVQVDAVTASVLAAFPGLCA